MTSFGYTKANPSDLIEKHSYRLNKKNLRKVVMILADSCFNHADFPSIPACRSSTFSTSYIYVVYVAIAFLILFGTHVDAYTKPILPRVPNFRIYQKVLSNDAITRKLVSNDVSHVGVLPAPLKPKPRPDPVVNNADGFSFCDDLDAYSFGSIFRQCAPYIAMHRGSTMVIHLGGKSLHSREDFDAVIDDISILHLLGVQLVLVAGVRKQLDDKMREKGHNPQYHDGMRVTDDETMQYLKETSGSARFEIESSLARGFRGRPGQSGISVVSGNFFYSAKPLGYVTSPYLISTHFTFPHLSSPYLSSPHSHWLHPLLITNNTIFNEELCIYFPLPSPLTPPHPPTHPPTQTLFFHY